MSTVAVALLDSLKVSACVAACHVLYCLQHDFLQLDSTERPLKRSRCADDDRFRFQLACLRSKKTKSREHQWWKYYRK